MSGIAIKGKKVRDDRPRESKNRITLISIIVIAGFFIFMFSSKYVIKPTHRVLELGPVETELGEYRVESWEWNKLHDEMQVFISVNGPFTAPKEVSGRCMFTTNTGKTIKNIDVLLFNTDYIVVRFDSVNSFSELTVAVTIDNTIVRFRNNSEDIEVVDSLTEWNDISATIFSKEQRIEHYNAAIDENLEVNGSNELKRQELAHEILEIREKEKYMTVAQLEQAERQISNLENEREVLAQDTSSRLLQNVEYRKRIANINKELADIRGETREDIE